MEDKSIVTAEELAEWKRLFKSAPLEGFSYVNLQGGVSDDLPFSPSPSFEKAIALAEFLTAARTGWPRTVLDLESLRRERDELRTQLNAMGLPARFPSVPFVSQSIAEHDPARLAPTTWRDEEEESE